LQIAERRAPTTNDQELPKILRNLCNEIAMRQFAVLQNAISRNKRTHQNADLQDEGAAVLAPHGAFRSMCWCLFMAYCWAHILMQF